MAEDDCHSHCFKVLPFNVQGFCEEKKGKKNRILALVPIQYTYVFFFFFDEHIMGKYLAVRSYIHEILFLTS